MFLTEEQQAILNGSKGETMAKVMESVVRYGELFGAEKLIPVTSKYNHLVTSFGLKALGPVYDLMNKLIEDGAISGQKFSVDPRPCDPNVPKNFIQDITDDIDIFNKFRNFENLEIKEEALKFAAWWDCKRYMDYPHSLILIYENIDEILRTDGTYDVMDGFNQLQLKLVLLGLVSP